jgi:hypothetical protein
MVQGIEKHEEMNKQKKKNLSRKGYGRQGMKESEKCWGKEEQVKPSWKNIDSVKRSGQAQRNQAHCMKCTGSGKKG